MLFAYPLAPHVRRHGPRGYRRYEKFKPWLRDEFALRLAILSTVGPGARLS